MGRFVIRETLAAPETLYTLTVPDCHRDEIITDIEMIIDGISVLTGNVSVEAILYAGVLASEPIKMFNNYNLSHRGIWLPAKDLKIAAMTPAAAESVIVAFAFTTSEKARKGLYVRC